MAIDMAEPDWTTVEARILALKARQVNAIASRWFSGSMGGAFTKRDKAQTMASQMRNWWRLVGYGSAPRERVANVLKMLEAEERR